MAALLSAFLLMYILAGCGRDAQKGGSGERAGGWQKALGGETCEYAYDIAAVPGGGFAVTGDRGERDG